MSAKPTIWFRVASGLLAVVSATACGKAGRPEVAALVDGQRIDARDVERLTARWMDSQLRRDAESHASRVARTQGGGEQASAGPQVERLDRREVGRLVLGYLIRRSFLQSLAERHGVHLDADPEAAAVAGAAPDDQLALAGWDRSEIEGSFEAGRLSKALAGQLFPDVTVSEAELRKRFDERPLVFGRSWRIKVLAASFDGPAPVAPLQEAVRRGEAFPDAARRLGTKENLDLGTVNSTRPLPEPIRAALGSLRPGAVSPSVVAGAGSVAFYAVSREDLPALSFDEAKPALNATLIDETRQDLFARWFDDQLHNAPVRVDDHYGHWKDGQVLQG